MSQELVIKFPSRMEKLKEGTWLSWHREVKMALHAQRAFRYVDGTYPKPDDTKKHKAWHETNDQIISALGTIVSPPLQRELQTIKIVKDTWERLKAKTYPKGIISKLDNMQSVIRNRFSSSVPFSTTITQIRDAIAAVHKPNAPTQDEWLIICLLNALSDSEYDWLRKQMLSFMTNLKNQLTADDIIDRLETEERKGKELTPDGERVMAARGSKHKSTKPNKTKCGNC
ncbi:hypothetical protein K439DRAFT_1616158 [Ramaria rubella]|nr:hypothetical protein K439DRAFT_1616158 [Ramaria rubella]